MKWYYEWKEKAKALKEEKYQEALAIIKMYNELEELKNQQLVQKERLLLNQTLKSKVFYIRSK